MRTRGNPLLGLIVVGFMFIVVLGLSIHLLSLDEAFDQSTHRSQATIERDWTTRGSKGSVNYHTHYHYMDDAGHVWSGDASIARETYRRLHIGEIVPVKYLDDPAGRSRIDWPVETEYHWRQDKVMGCFALGLGALWLLIFFTRPARG